MNGATEKLALASVLVAGLALSGCATAPGGNYHRGYQPPAAYSNQGARCRSCGVVQEVRQVQLRGGGNDGTLGAIIGAVAGGVLGHTVGKGDGRKAATVIGAVAGGVVGNQVGKSAGGDAPAWRIVVQLDDGQYATVTQRDNPGVRQGDYVEVRGGQVYPR
ncbi:MAG: glycine zipper 2TM domain-containing protein [Xanthomonadaceae bacterium]|nr:glycine zipper 2TM domain-containing protein [Xanthomonadaceae bacterium]